jgi:hypothetical protein
MYKVVLVLSLVMWAFVIAIIVSTPSDARRALRLLRGTSGKATPPFSPLPPSSMAVAPARAADAATHPANHRSASSTVRHLRHLG